ncbi:MAG TPA: RNA polymerase sigma factor [Gemmatimonadaceae bacterium]|nr:RNA polymerase sigma factor [Gemmatimonadaceae bacterium]
MSQSDEELVALILRNDTAAFEVLMRRYFRMAFLVAFAQVGDRHDAEDVCQDAFVRCWERMRECRDARRVSHWIMTIVRNIAHNRRDYLDLRATEPLEAGTTVAAAGRADRDATLKELRARLTAALFALPAIQREVVLLHDYEGWKHAEVAERLGLSEVMSRRHLSDARKRLRGLLSDLSAMEPDHD